MALPTILCIVVSLSPNRHVGNSRMVTSANARLFSSSTMAAIIQTRHIEEEIEYFGVALEYAPVPSILTPPGACTFYA